MSGLIKDIIINAYEEPFFNNFSIILESVKTNAGRNRIRAVVTKLYKDGVFKDLDESIEEITDKVLHDYCVGYTFEFLTKNIYQPLYPDYIINLIVVGELAKINYE